MFADASGVAGGGFAGMGLDPFPDVTEAGQGGGDGGQSSSLNAGYSSQGNISNTSDDALLPNGVLYGSDSGSVPYQNAWGGMSYQKLDSDGSLFSDNNLGVLGYGQSNASTNDPLLSNYVAQQSSGFDSLRTEFSSDLGAVWKEQQQLDVNNGTYVGLYNLYGEGMQPNPIAWQQGGDGDCYFVSAGEQVTVTNPSAITSDIAPHLGADGNWDGTYDVNFPGVNQITNVTGTGALQGPPGVQGIQENGYGAYAQVLEKGWASVDGGWSGINAGDPANAMFAITGDGGINEYIPYNGSTWDKSWAGVVTIPAQTNDPSAPRYQDYSPNMTYAPGGLDWPAITNSWLDGAGVVVATGADPIVNRGAECYAWPTFPDYSGGLVAQHAYELSGVGYDPNTGDLQEVTLQNPYGPNGAVASPISNSPINVLQFAPLTLGQLNEYTSSVIVYTPRH